MAPIILLLPLFLSLSLVTLAQADISSCPLLGPDLPAPVRPSANQAVAEAKQAVASVIERALRSNGTYDSNSTSFSLEIYSLHEPDPLFTYHFSAPILAEATEGVATVDSHTIYRIASISKVWTVYMYLIAVGDASFNDPITKYVPELAEYARTQAEVETDDIDTVNWEDITVGSLASHLAGIGRDRYLSPIYDPLFLSLGFPPVPSLNAVFCGNGTLPEICSRAAFFDAFLFRHPTVAPFSTPAYSNVAFTLLGFALENITGTSLPDLFNSTLTDPLGLDDSSYAQPVSTENSIIPPADSANSSSYGDDSFDWAPGGGYYSSLSDMTKFGRSILNSSFLTPAQTRRWLKPKAFTGNVNVSVGAPWEIYRAPGNRVSYLYTKNGYVTPYASELALMPDYDVGFSVLAAGPASLEQVVDLSDLLTRSFYTALEATAKEEASAIYAGTFRDPTGMNSSIDLVTDDQPGLRIRSWIFNGSHFPSLPSTGAQSSSNASQTGQNQNLTIRLYPTGLKTTDAAGRVTRTAWRATFDTPTSSVERGPFSSTCQSWGALDSLQYGGIGADEFVFNLGLDGKAVSVEPRALQQDPLQRQAPAMSRRSI